MSANAFTNRPARSFAMGIGKPSPGKVGGAASARKARGVAVPSLSNLRGAPPLMNQRVRES